MDQETVVLAKFGCLFKETSQEEEQLVAGATCFTQEGVLRSEATMLAKKAKRLPNQPWKVCQGNTASQVAQDAVLRGLL